MKPILFLDLDGTLIDSHMRCYQLFIELIPDFDKTFADYFDLKKDGTSNVQILMNHGLLTPQDSYLFTQLWLHKIEEPERLQKDILFPGVKKWLENASVNYSLILCTARQSSVNTQIQLKQLGIFDAFNEILITEQVKSKKDLIETVKPFAKDSWIIGDSPDDITNGIASNLQTCAVLTGFRDEATLEQYSPQMIIPAIVEFPII